MDYANSLRNRFQKKFTKGNKSACWEWNGSVSRYGYGNLRNIPGERPLLIMAHRMSWEMHNGKQLPSGMCVCHSCDNRLCVNPSHLFLGTKAENNSDRDSKARQAMGQRNGNAKLSEADVLKIRSLSGVSNPEIAAMFGISRITVWEIVTFRKWKHLKSTAAD